MILSMLLAAPIMAAGGIIMALRTDAGLSWIIAAAVGVIGLVVSVIALKALPLFKSIQKKIDRVNLVLREGLTGIRVIRAFNKNKYESERFDEANKDLTHTSINVYRWMGILMPGIMLLMNVTMVAIIWFGGQRISSGDMYVGDLMAFQQYVMQVMFSLIMATMLFVMLPRASASAERINEILDMPISITDKTDKIPQTTCRGCVEFKNVSFSYYGAEEPAICDISLSANPGEVTAIIGGTGSGKSTLVKMIPRFYDVTQGQVFVDGVDVKDYPQLTLRERIGYVPQKINLMSGTIAENIRYGKKDATDEEITVALETAQANEFVSELENGIESIVAQGGY